MLQLSDNCCGGETSWLNCKLVSSTLKSGFSPELQNPGLFFLLIGYFLSGNSKTSAGVDPI